MDLLAREPAREVAPAGRRRHHPGEREPGVGEREHERPRVDDHKHLAGRLLEQPAELLAEDLERLEHRGGPLSLVGFVPRGEGQRVGLDPGHGRVPSHGWITRASCCWACWWPWRRSAWSRAGSESPIRSCW